MKHVIGTRWLANLNLARSHLPHKFWSSYENFNHCQRFSCSWSGHIGPPIMLTVEPRMAIKFWARNLISFKHKSFWHSFSNPHLNTHTTQVQVSDQETQLWKIYQTKVCGPTVAISNSQINNGRRMKLGTVLSQRLSLKVSESELICNFKQFYTLFFEPSQGPSQLWC